MCKFCRIFLLSRALRKKEAGPVLRVDKVGNVNQDAAARPLQDGAKTGILKSERG